MKITNCRPGASFLDSKGRPCPLAASHSSSTVSLQPQNIHSFQTLMERKCDFNHSLRSTRRAGGQHQRCLILYSNQLLTQTALLHTRSTQQVGTALLTLPLCETIILFRVMKFLGLGLSSLCGFEKRPGQEDL